MSPDGITLSLIVRELQQLLPGRVDRVHQPDKQEVVMVIRSAGQNYRLLFSAQADNARLHLTAAERPNPPRPPLFCLVLRKYLEGSRLVGIEQSGLDRVVNCIFSRLGESGGYQELTLSCEIMGKHSNLVLHESGGLVLDGIKRYSHALSRYREVLPGRPYLPPPPQQKLDPRELDEESFSTLLLSGKIDQRVSEQIFRRLAGVGPELAQELLLRANLEPELTLEYCGAYELQRLWQEIGEVVLPLLQGRCAPAVAYRGSAAVACYPIPLAANQGLRQVECPSVNHCFDLYYRSRSELAALDRLRHSLLSVARHEQGRCSKKLALQQEAEDQARTAQAYRLQGEMIYAHLHQIKSGDREALLPNLYDPEAPPLRVELDPDLSPVQNAQLLLRRYDKARDSLKIVMSQKQRTSEELDYLAGVSNAVQQADSLDELQEIRQELEETGYLAKKVRENKGRAKKRESAVRKQTQCTRVQLEDGCEVLIGKNNKQNDYLTLRLANEEDMWLHVKGGAGAHVIIKLRPGAEITPHLLELAAGYAAYFSQERQSSKVAVDYTQKKHVSKPPKARPGYVIYKHYQTVYVKPQSPRSADSQMTVN
jgi:predicted ribosome quality control (RQC) complex YloA/Tae2 family protein